MENNEKRTVFCDEEFIDEGFEDFTCSSEKDLSSREMNLERTVEDLEDVSVDDIENFKDEIHKMAKDHNEKVCIEDIKDELKNESKAKTFITDCKDYLSSKEFDNKCKSLAKLYKVDKTRIAESFAQRVLGTIGDTLGIVIKITYGAVKFLIGLLCKLLYSGCGIICSIALKLTNFFTLGYTCKGI